jgi:hypothetical protein
MTTINRLEYGDQSWKKEVTNALEKGDSVTLKNFRFHSDMNHCEEIGKIRRVRVTLHLDHTVCCFEIDSQT